MDQYGSLQLNLGYGRSIGGGGLDSLESATEPVPPRMEATLMVETERGARRRMTREKAIVFDWIEVRSWANHHIFISTWLVSDGRQSGYEKGWMEAWEYCYCFEQVRGALWRDPDGYVLTEITMSRVDNGYVRHNMSGTLTCYQNMPVDIEIRHFTKRIFISSVVSVSFYFYWEDSSARCEMRKLFIR